MINFLIQNYTGPFAFDKNLLPRAPGASKALDALGSQISISCFCLERVCSKVINLFLKMSPSSYIYAYIYTHIYVIYMLM